MNNAERIAGHYRVKLHGVWRIGCYFPGVFSEKKSWLIYLFDGTALCHDEHLDEIIETPISPSPTIDWDFKIKRFLHLSRYDGDMPTEHKKMILEKFRDFMNGDDKDKWYNGNAPETITI